MTDALSTALPVDLTPLLVHLPVWGMVLFRLTGLFIMAPVFGSGAIPRTVKVYFALALSFCIYPMLVSPASRIDSASLHAGMTMVEAFHRAGLELWNIPVAIGRELLIGYVLGLGASLPMVGMQMGGYLIDQQIGMGLAGIFNPELDDQATVLSEFKFIIAITLFLTLGGHQVLLGALLDSFRSVPLGGFRVDGGVLEMVLGLMASMLNLAFRVAAPVLLLVFLETVAMGFLARTLPQLNLLSVGYPLRIFMGIAIMILMLSVLAAVYREEMGEMLHVLVRMTAPRTQ